MFEVVFALAALTIADPAGDVAGRGDLQPPTAAVYRNIAAFDLRGVTVTDDPMLTLRIELGSLANPFELPLGFSLPVVEVYIEGGEGTSGDVLPGSGMRLPPGRSWGTAVRLTGETAEARRSGPDGEETVSPGVTIEGNTIVVSTPFERPTRPRVYAMTGLYDLFGASPWRQIEAESSPWAFSSPEPGRPVVDVLGVEGAAQAQAIESGVLPPPAGRGNVAGAPWLVLMAVGMALALAGIVMRTVSRSDSRATEPATTGPEPEAIRLETEPAGAAPPASIPGGAETEGISRAGDPAPDDRVVSASTRDSRRGPDTAAGNAASRDDSASTRAVNEDDAGTGFTWDSTALLTEPADEEDLDAGFAQSFSRGSVGARESWERPVPLPVEEEASDAPGAREHRAEDAGDEPEVVTGEEELETDEAARGRADREDSGTDR